MKKKLSLLLAAMLVMTLVPMSSFAASIENLSVYDFTTDDENVDVTFTYEESNGSATMTTGAIVFGDITNKAVINSVKAVIGSELIEGKGSVVTADADFVDEFNKAGAKEIKFTLNMDFSDCEVGKVAVQLDGQGVKLQRFTKDIANIVSNEAGDTLAISVKDSSKEVSERGGELSTFTIKNFTNVKHDLVIALDNDAEFVKDTSSQYPTLAKVYVDGQEIVSPFNTDGNIKLVFGADFTKATKVIEVRPYVNVTNSDFAEINVNINANGKNDDEYVSSAKIGSVVDFGVTVKVVENGKKDIPTLLGGQKTTLKVTIKGPKGSITTARNYDIALDGAKMAKANVEQKEGIDAVTYKKDDADKTKVEEFTLTPNSDTKMEFVADFYVSADALDGVATMTVSSRDLKEDIVVDIAKVEKAYDIDTKVIEFKRGESGASEDVVITETKVGQLKTNEYLYVVYNGKILMNEKPEIEGTNGLKFGKVEWIKDDNKDTVGFRTKVEGKSSKEVGEITISGMTVDMAYNAIHDRTYTASLYTGTAKTDTYDTKATGVTENNAIALFEEFDYAKCVAEYATVKSTVVFTLGSANYTVDGVVKTLEAPVFTKDNRTMLPIGPLALALGLEVNYNADTQTATFRDARTGQVVSVKENASVLYNNGIEYKMHTAAVTVNGRIFIPVASITDAFGAQITWDEATQTVTIVK